MWLVIQVLPFEEYLLALMIKIRNNHLEELWFRISNSPVFHSHKVKRGVKEESGFNIEDSHVSSTWLLFSNLSELTED